MGWERQKPFTTDKPAPPSSSGWLISGVLAMIASVLLFVLHASGSLSILNSVDIWLFSLIPTVLWILVFSTQGYLYGRKIEHFQFLQHEAEHAQQQWIAWAERYLAVQASCLLLPDHISAALLQQNPRNLQQYKQLVRRINYLTGSKKNRAAEAITTLLGGTENALLSLPDEISLQITLLTDESELSEQNLLILFDDCWKEKFPGRPGPSSLNLTDHLSFNIMDERLRQPESTVHLILVMQLQGGEHYSDGLAALLFTSDDLAHKFSLPHAVRLLRPMQLDMHNFTNDLTLFLTTQTQAVQTVRVLGDQHVWTESSAEIIKSGSASGARWKADDLLFIETYCGIQGPYSPWFTLALGADLVRIRQQSWLALSTTGAENFVYTITSGSGDERIK